MSVLMKVMMVKMIGGFVRFNGGGSYHPWSKDQPPLVKRPAIIKI